jgi:hypothetical protein
VWARQHSLHDMSDHQSAKDNLRLRGQPRTEVVQAKEGWLTGEHRRRPLPKVTRLTLVLYGEITEGVR